MIEIHHLNESRSRRITWMLEELGHEYKIISYQRDPKTRLAPPELKAIHPLGKAPVIRDGEEVLIESGAIRPVIDRVFPFEMTDEALAYVETGRAKGKVVIKIR